MHVINDQYLSRCLFCHRRRFVFVLLLTHPSPMYYVYVVVFIRPMKNTNILLGLWYGIFLILSLLPVASAVSPADFGSG
jgi:hypothetical protein